MQEKFSLKVKRFSRQCWRVLKITKKPDREEFITLVRVSGIGIAAVGLLGFFLFMTWKLVFGSAI